LSNNRIDRKEKMAMRKHLERFSELHEEMGRLIENCRQEVGSEAYLIFLDQLQYRNLETNKMLKEYMVRKCNR
jgi:hypothetical protein